MQYANVAVLTVSPFKRIIKDHYRRDGRSWNTVHRFVNKGRRASADWRSGLGAAEDCFQFVSAQASSEFELKMALV